MTENGADRETRWSANANKTTDAVQRLLRGEKLDESSWKLHVEAHRLATWRDEFLAAAKEGLEGPAAGGGGHERRRERRRLREVERKVGEMTLDNDILRAAARRREARDPGEAAAVSAEALRAAGPGPPPPQGGAPDRERPPPPGM